MPVKVLVVDDSALIREMLSSLIARDPDLQVVGTAHDPYDAREKIRVLAPDVVTLDVEMPNMNGIAFLERLMRLKPMPVVMVSTLTQKGADVTLLALELGAVDFIAKPTDQGEANWERAGAELRAKLKAAAATRLESRAQRAPVAPPRPSRTPFHSRALVAIGASTGGVEALRDVLLRLPADMPPIAITQHMPPGFTARFAARLDESCALKVSEAADGRAIRPGEVVIAPGNRHLSVVVREGHYVCRLDDSEPVSGHRPSVDVLFHSAAQAAGRHGLGVILTGMGRDGAQGLLAMRGAGARTIGQNEATSLVYGMPRAAKDIGAVATEVALDAVAERILTDLASDAAGTLKVAS